MDYFIAFLIVFVITIIISVLWVNGINNMSKYHPDYTGDDFLNWEEKENK
jgi:hypothetical protein